MRTPSVLLIALAVGVIGGVGPASQADAAPRATPKRGLDMTTTGPSVAAQAAQAARSPTPAPLPIPPAETATSAVVSGVTVLAEQKGRVIASSDAASLASPDFTAADAQDPPLAVSIGDNMALGRMVLPNEPPPAGLLRTNPDLVGSPERGYIGVAGVF